MRIVTHGATDQSVELYIVDADGLPATGLAYNSSGIDLWYRRNGAAVTSITEATQTASGAHSDGGFVGLGNGVYRLDPPDAAFASGVSHVTFGGTLTGYTVYPVTVQLSAFDLQTATQAVNVTQFGGSNGTFASGRPETNVTHIAGSSVSTSTAQIGVNVVNFGGSAGTFSSGRPEVNTSHWGGTAIASASVRSNVLSINGTALSEGTPGNIASNFGTFFDNNDSNVTASIVDDVGYLRGTGVNVVTWGGTAVGSALVRSNVIQNAGTNITSSSGRQEVNTTHIAGTSQTAHDIGSTANKLNTGLELDGSVYRWTTNALEQGPSGGGGGGSPWDALVADYDTTGTFGALVMKNTDTITIDQGNIEDIADIIGTELQGLLGTTQPRINQPPDPGFTTQVSRRSDGTYKCTKPIRITSGNITLVYAFIDMSPLFGPNNLVETVGTPTVSGGSVTAEATGPRDTYAVVELDGTATAGEERTVTVPVTMSSGTQVDVVFDLEVFD